MARITKLTPEQEAMLAVCRDEWLAHGLSTEPADRPTAEQGVRDAYRAAGLNPPRLMIWLDSPWAGVIGQAIAPAIVRPGRVDAQVGAQVHDLVGAQVDAQVRAQVRALVGAQVGALVGAQVYAQVRAQVGAQVGAQVYAQVDAQVRAQVGAQVRAQVGAQVRAQVGAQVGAQVYAQVHAQVHAQVDAQVHAQVDAQSNWWKGRIAGQHWAGYYSYYAAMESIGVTGLEPIHGCQMVARSAGWWWSNRDFAILTERPRVLLRDALNRLHCDDGPALLYPDGWGVWAWHGTRVPRDLIDGKWSTTDILREPNAEIRRCAIEKLGWPQFVQQAGLQPVSAAVPDPGNPGHELVLYDIPEQIFNEPVRVLLCTNGTPERDGTRRSFGLTVPATVKTPIAAAAWGYDLNPSQYAQLARRS